MTTEIKMNTMVGEKLRKKDVVVLMDGRLGEVLDRVTDSVYKIKILDSGHVDYFENSKVKIKKQFILNRLKDIIGL